MNRLLSFDIGSTYSKGTVFSLNQNKLQVEERCTVATTPEYLPDGFEHLLECLNISHRQLKKMPTAWSSSAKGGLGIIVIGIVPELTLKIAREAACSAGGRIIALYNYRLNSDDIANISRTSPDILLFTGGTDGGNENIIIHNAKMLKAIDQNIVVIYAGNRTVRPQIREIFVNHELHITDNVLRNIDLPDPIPARNAIRKIFLQKIVSGKGLDAITELTGTQPLPTPYSMLEFIKTITNYSRSREFCVIDLGGATTDFYSSCTSHDCNEIIFKGLPEPNVKRSVEGDAGMRLSATATYKTAKNYIRQSLIQQNLPSKDFDAYVHKISDTPESLPNNKQQDQFDRILAAACIITASERHAGKRRKIYTANGSAEIQTGKDISHAKAVICTGGYLAGCDNNFMNRTFAEILPEEKNTILLLPAKPIFYFDSNYLFPLLANAARLYPALTTDLLYETFPKEM